jgi:hypothetical protein
VAFVKIASWVVGFAEFEEDARDGGAAEIIEGGEQECGRDALAAEITMDGDIEDFGLVSNLAGRQEADELGICFAHEESAARRSS